MSNLAFSKKMTVMGLSAVLMLILSGCEGIKESLGFGGAKAPDEFMVTTHPPLTLPPDFALVPPVAGAPNRNSGTPANQAETALTNGKNLANRLNDQPASAGEANLIAKTGIGNVPSDIRRLVEQETASINRSNRSLLGKLFSSSPGSNPGVVLDPTKEKQRIDENLAAGRPLSTGETPVLKVRKRSFFDSLF
ncbi:MAG: DUF3035 domain-containing protein [Rhodospirillaceae bacterium]|nr:DUF3035 domain-containing protein [Rhodospirillaceae bacterium]